MRDARGFTLIELMLVMLILAILAGIAMANYWHVRIQATETAAVAALTAINQAQAAYMHTCGRQKFAPSLSALGKSNPATSGPYLSPDLAGSDEVVKSGYRIVMEGKATEGAEVTCTGDTPADAYHVTADPVVPGTTGRRYFGTNVNAIIYQNTDASFAGKMPDVGPPDMGQEVKGRAGNLPQ